MKPKTHPKTKRKTATPPAPPSARAYALGLLTRVLGEKQTLDEAVAAQPYTGGEADGRFATLLVLSVLRHLGQLDGVIAHYLEKKIPAKRVAVMHALRLGVVQLLLLDTPPHAAVNETVALVKKGKDAALAGLVNAVMQKIAQERPTLPAATCNLPEWLAARWSAWYGAEAVAAMAETALLRPALDLQSAQPMDAALRLDPLMLRLPADHPPVEHLPGYAEGAFFVQDIAASYPVRLLGEVTQRQVLDLCAAPGGKAMQLIQAGGFVTAVDRSAPRMRLLKANLARMGMEANRITADVLAWEPSRQYDAILLDAPCSATGTWRRHPEVVQNVTEKDITELAVLQRQLLARAWNWLKPGGRLVYCVCSLEREEGEAQAAWFAAQQADATLIPASEAQDIPSHCVTTEGYLRTRPDLLEGGMDGFFAACWRKA